MNNTHGSGVSSSTCIALRRRVHPMMVLVCALLCFMTGVISLPRTAHAATSRAPVAQAKPVNKTSSKSKKRVKTPYVRSIISAEERDALKERGISSGFGPRAVSPRATRLHKGIDISAPKDSKIMAFNDGKVTFVGRKNGYGIAVIVSQIDGREALYAHMNKAVVVLGEEVKRGTHIGHVGRTGRATGYHLHFEIIDDGENLDPADHVWNGAELVLGPNDLDPTTVEDQIKVASPRITVPIY